MNNQEEKEIVLLSDFCWVLFDREQRHRLQKKEEDTTRGARDDDDDSLGGGSRSFPLESSYHHHHHHHHHHRECISKRERKRHNVPSLRRQSIFADVRIFPRGVPVDFTERLAPRRRTMMIPMLHLYGPFVRLRAHSKQIMRALCAAAAARRKGVDDDDDTRTEDPTKVF